MQFGGLAWEEKDPAVARLFSYPSPGCEVLKIGKGVSRVNELPDERHPIEGIAIREQPIQRKCHLPGVFSIFPQRAVDSL